MKLSFFFFSKDALWFSTLLCGHTSFTIDSGLEIYALDSLEKKKSRCFDTMWSENVGTVLKIKELNKNYLVKTETSQLPFPQGSPMPISSFHCLLSPLPQESRRFSLEKQNRTVKLLGANFSDPQYTDWDPHHFLRGEPATS